MPDDDKRIAARTFTNLNSTNINYFVNADADDAYPNMFLFGDDNFAIDGITVKSGVANLWTNRSLGWTAQRHHFASNVTLADGSVSQFSNSAWTNALAQPGNETNLVVIP